MNKSQALDRLRQVLRRQHKALATEDCYTFWVRRYMVALQSMPKDLPSEEKLERFLTGLALRENVAASTQNQAFNAVVFFYKGKQRSKSRGVASQQLTFCRALVESHASARRRRLVFDPWFIQMSIVET